MTEHGVESDGLEKGPPILLAIPQELRDHILLEVLQSNDIITFDSEGFISKGSRKVKISYYGLDCSCKQLHQEARSIFFKSNTFQFWAQHKIPRISDVCFRLIRNLDIFAVCVIGSRLKHVVACIEIRGATVAGTVDGKTRQYYKNGTEEGTGTEENEYHTDDMFDRLKPSLKMLHEALQHGHGLGIKALKKIQRAMDKAR